MKRLTTSTLTQEIKSHPIIMGPAANYSNLEITSLLKEVTCFMFMTKNEQGATGKDISSVIL